MARRTAKGNNAAGLSIVNKNGVYYVYRDGKEVSSSSDDYYNTLLSNKFGFSDDEISNMTLSNWSSDYSKRIENNYFNKNFTESYMGYLNNKNIDTLANQDPVINPQMHTLAPQDKKKKLNSLRMGTLRTIKTSPQGTLSMPSLLTPVAYAAGYKTRLGQ